MTGTKRKLSGDYNLPEEIKTLDDLLDVAWYYKGNKFNSFNLWKAIPYIEQLRNLVGMNKLKDRILSMILYYIGDFHITINSDNKRIDNGEMMHIVIYGPPGCGKTSVIDIISNILFSIGCIKSSNVIKKNKSDFISDHIGGSEAKTKKILDDAVKNHSILLIDETYSFGSRDVDSFSKIIIDLLNQYLSEHKKDFICIIAGYKDDIERYFFKVNKGLERRFPWKFEIEPYLSSELLEIFKKKVKKEKWIIDDDLCFKESDFDPSIFSFYGGDIDNLFSMCKTQHIRRVFGKDKNLQKIISKNDFKRAYTIFIESKPKSDTKYLSMYM